MTPSLLLCHVAIGRDPPAVRGYVAAHAYAGVESTACGWRWHGPVGMGRSGASGRSAASSRSTPSAPTSILKSLEVAKERNRVPQFPDIQEQLRLAGAKLTTGEASPADALRELEGSLNRIMAK